MIRRFPAVLRFLPFLFCSLLYLCVLFTDSRILPCSVITIAWIGSMLFFHSSRRCPCCLRFGLDNRPFSKNSGYCSHCGKLIEYREELMI